jgi:hypothetical protein
MAFSLLKGMSNWLKPVLARPVVAQCLNLVRDFANKRHKKIIKLAKGKLVYVYMRLYMCEHFKEHICVYAYRSIYV